MTATDTVIRSAQDAAVIAARFPRFELRSEALRAAGANGLAEAVEVLTVVEADEDCDDMIQRIAKGEEAKADALAWWMEWGNRRAEAAHAIDCALIRGTIDRTAVEVLLLDGDYKAEVLRLEELAEVID